MHGFIGLAFYNIGKLIDNGELKGQLFFFASFAKQLDLHV